MGEGTEKIWRAKILQYIVYVWATAIFLRDSPCYPPFPGSFHTLNDEFTVIAIMAIMSL
jgi:hypothetical protein